MKFKLEICITVITLLFSSIIWNSIYAEELTPIGKLAQDYILRLNEDLSRNNQIVPGANQNSVIVNPEAVKIDAVAESIDTISKTVKEVRVKKDKVVDEIKESVKKDIDDSIINIRKENEQKPAFELQRAVDDERIGLFENITQKVDSIKPTKDIFEEEKIKQLKEEIDDSLEKIRVNLEEESGLPVNFERSKRDIKESLLKFERELEEKKELIDSREGELIFLDSDGDGISDYDEIYLYKTDPNNARTVGGEKTDGEKIREGLNPLSEEEDKITYQDPREDRESFVSEAYKLEKVELIPEEKKLVFEGFALPNTYITLYIYSTPIVVTVKTDETGKWSYQLDKELENGEHQVYVASVDNSGKIIARSNPILFTKSAEAATIGIAPSIESTFTTKNFLKDNFILITLATLIAVVILGMMFVGNHKTVGSAVADLRNQINSK